MPYQNRVNPSGELVRVADRGLFMGNRGVLHNEFGEVIRSWKTKAWITCLLDFKGRKRENFTPGRYSELFFLDEVTALSAGHRPCGECRYRDYIEFKTLWLQANQELIRGKSTQIGEIDVVVHKERISKNGQKTTYKDGLETLPDGVFIRFNKSDSMYLVKGSYLYKWSPGGYALRAARDSNIKVEVLTPRSIIKALKAGYEPRIHHSIDGLRQL